MNSSNESKQSGFFRNKIAYIVPTRNRPRILARLLDSIKIQTVAPDQVIIVDGSDQQIEAEIKPYLNVSYLRVFPPGLTKQRNEGRKALREDVTLVGYLDDDLVLEKDSTEAMLKFWETAPEIMGGASFNITNFSPGKPILLTRLFCINNGEPGRVLRSGSNIGYDVLTENIYTQWLSGGATIWRRKVFAEFKYDEWYKGHFYFEDVDFSFTVAKRYKLAVIQSARVDHLPPPVKPQKLTAFIKTHVIQQYYFVKKHKELSLPLFYWSILGNIIISVLVGLKRLRPASFVEAGGYVLGLTEVVTGKIKQVTESFRE